LVVATAFERGVDDLDPALELRDLAPEVGRGARKIGDVVTNIGAVARVEAELSKASTVNAAIATTAASVRLKPYER
jgi:hypothetical protein